jgi:hypothetical protein
MRKRKPASLTLPRSVTDPPFRLTIMQMIKQCFFLLVLGTAALFMPHAKATCTTPDLPKMINVASISVPTTLAVGETIPVQSKSPISPVIVTMRKIRDWKLSLVTTALGLRFQA